jgi:hypothetical protein
MVDTVYRAEEAIASRIIHKEFKKAIHSVEYHMYRRLSTTSNFKCTGDYPQLQIHMRRTQSTTLNISCSEQSTTMNIMCRAGYQQLRISQKE